MSIQEAKERITKEAGTSGQLAVIGKYIIEELLTCEVNATKVLDPQKSLDKAMNSVKAQAQKVAKNGMAMIEDNEVYGWIREYYGISDLTVVKPAGPAAPPNDLANVSLFDLL